MKIEPLPVTHMLTHKSAYPKKPTDGDLLVYHFFEQSGNGQTMHLYPVSSPEEAIKVINKLADEQVNDDDIGFNVLDLCVYNGGDEQDWEDWYSDDYNTIREYEELSKKPTH